MCMSGLLSRSIRTNYCLAPCRGSFWVVGVLRELLRWYFLTLQSEWVGRVILTTSQRWVCCWWTICGFSFLSFPSRYSPPWTFWNPDAPNFAQNCYLSLTGHSNIYNKRWSAKGGQWMISKMPLWNLQVGKQACKGVTQSSGKIVYPIVDEFQNAKLFHIWTCPITMAGQAVVMTHDGAAYTCQSLQNKGRMLLMSPGSLSQKVIW